MTIPIDPALVGRLSGEFDALAGEFDALGGHLTTLGRDLAALHRQVTSLPIAPVAGAITTETGSPPQQTTGSPGVPPGPVPAAGVRDGGVHTPQQPGPVSPGGGVGPGTPPAAGGDAPFGPGGPGAPASAATVPAAHHGRARATAREYRAAQARPVSGATAPPPPGPYPPHSGPTRARASITPWWQREGVISRLLAVAGVAVTLIGVVMLLILAAQAGIFGPVPRVVTGAVLSVALVGAGFRVFQRPGGRVGAVALAATGCAGAYLDVVAMTTVYHWLHPVLGFAAALGVAAAGLGVAAQWRSQPLAVLVVVGAAVSAPFVTLELAVLAFLIVLHLTCVPVQMRFDWPILHVARTVPAVVATHIAILAVTFDPSDGRRVTVLLAATGLAVVGTGGTLLVTRRRPEDLVASLTCALAGTPLLVVPALFDRPVSTLVSAGYAATMLAIAATTLVPALRAHVAGHTAFVTGALGSFAVLETVWGVTAGATLPWGLLLVATCYLGVAGQTRNRAAAAFGGGYAILGGLALVAVAGPQTLAGAHRAVVELGTTTAAAAITGLGVLAVGLWTTRRLFGTTDHAATTVLWVGASAAALYLVTTAAVALGVTAAGATGFVPGHSVSTVVWMGSALAALLYGLRRLGEGASTAVKVALGSGLLVTAAALAKLFLFDLSTLDGLFRVAAFLVVGILLLIAGTRYARAFADSGSRSTATGAPGVHR